MEGQDDAIANYLDNVARSAANDREAPEKTNESGTLVARNTNDESTAEVEIASELGKFLWRRWDSNSRTVRIIAF